MGPQPVPIVIMKEAPDVDYYVGWSRLVGAPVFAGTRIEVLEHLNGQSDPWLSNAAPHHPEQRLKRVDETGTSSSWGDEAAGADGALSGRGFVEDGSWADAGGEAFSQRGICSRSNIFALARRLELDREADVTDLLQPFANEAEVRPA